MCGMSEQSLASAGRNRNIMNSLPNIDTEEVVVYNVPDGDNDDSEVIRAEMLFFNTPRTEYWANAVYGTIDNIQDQCYGDYMTLCEPEQSIFMVSSPETMATSPFLSDNSAVESMFNLHRDIRNFFDSDFDLTPQFTLDVPMPTMRRPSMLLDMDTRPFDLEIMKQDQAEDMSDVGFMMGTGFAFPSVLDALFDVRTGPTFSIVIDEMQRRLTATNEGWQLQHGRRMINALRSVYRRDLSKKIDTKRIAPIVERGKELHKDLKMKSFQNVLKKDDMEKKAVNVKNEKMEDAMVKKKKVQRSMTSKHSKDLIKQLPTDTRAPQRKLFTPVVPPFDVGVYDDSNNHMTKQVHTIARSGNGAALGKKLQDEDREGDLPRRWDPVIPPHMVPIKSPPPPSPEIHSELHSLFMPPPSLFAGDSKMPQHSKILRKEREVNADQMDHDGDKRHGRDGGRDVPRNAWDWGSDSDSDSDSEEDHHYKRRDKHPGPPPPPPYRLEDSFFPGALGFGAEGDKCLYESMPSLSPPCLESINKLYSLRERYWNDNQELEEQATEHHNGFWFWIAGALVLYLLVRVCGLKKKSKRTNKLLQALNADKQLKATVEAHTGLAVPEPEICPFGQENRNVSTCAKIVRVTVLFVFVVISSFIISVSSLEITSCIIDAMDGDGNYDSPPTSPLAALMILMFVCSLELCLFFFMLRGLRALCHGKESRNAPSAPLDYDSMHSNHGPNLAANSRNGFFPPSSSRLQQWRAYAANAFRRPTTSTSSIYQPLNPHDESMDITMHSVQSSVHSPMILPPSANGAEMVVVQARDGNHYAQHARPVSTVNFV